MDGIVVVCGVTLILLYYVFGYEEHVGVVGGNLVIHRAMYLLNLYSIMSNMGLERNLAKKGVYRHYLCIDLF